MSDEVKVPKELDPAVKQKVTYCIPNWLRDEQIKLATPRVRKRIQPAAEKRTDPIAIVCYGPSLADTWEEVRNFKYIMSMSGSHKFLLERGIVPTWHCEVDPREHKVHLIGQPHPDVEYLIASACHQKVFDHLENYNVTLWHVFSNEDEAIRTLPPGEWAITGGSGVGLRALVLARFMGFTDFHIFGMDGCEGKTGKHAAAHPSQAKGASPCVYNGVTYMTTPAFLECARETWHELDQLPGCTATFYGEGLVQAMAKDYKPQPTKKGDGAVIALNKPELISSEYKELNHRLHVENLAYGVGGGKFAETVNKLIKATEAESVLDYGCGKGYLAKALSRPIWEYDPAIPGKDESPRPADLVCCLDVLEHIEQDKLQFVLDDLRRVTKKVGFFVIHTGAAAKTYANGKNTHLIQEGKEWWEKVLSQFFNVAKIFVSENHLQVVVGPMKTKRTPHSYMGVATAVQLPGVTA